MLFHTYHLLAQCVSGTLTAPSVADWMCHGVQPADRHTQLLPKHPKRGAESDAQPDTC